jgi:hypothetical protein
MDGEVFEPICEPCLELPGTMCDWMDEMNRGKQEKKGSVLTFKVQIGE